MLRHDNVADDHKLIAPSHLFEDPEEQVTALTRAEERLPPVTTAGDEVEVSSAVAAHEVVAHEVERNAGTKMAQ